VSFRFSHVARLKYFQHRFYLPFTTAKTYYQVFEALEQIQGDCIVAIYAKSNPAIRSRITAMINKKSQPGMTVSAQTKLNVDMAREKAKATGFFDVDVFFGAKDRSMFSVMASGFPREISRPVYVSQRKFSYTMLRFHARQFEFESHEVKNGFSGRSGHLMLSAPELHSLITFPESISRLSMVFGRHAAYTHGSQIPAADVEDFFAIDDPGASQATDTAHDGKEVPVQPGDAS